ncbi:hypothetical protein SLNWT_4821 [Streptomyces albus]|uniref:Uncharacterized protein n=1 Tax=Streptomyces albus (strain ATCC 21838 / DSM 41398 / FERM P-419 / JCM 4703 / NBRC 107858) TaxID=1081613 RepID=A0A0B5F4F2_STRA4|nr:hypothetical protein SLNWT_4821 [Streptomyces albus]AOU79504.1 hypothetical protein SLNHY_4813 [Streptomyces albus]
MSVRPVPGRQLSSAAPGTGGDHPSGASERTPSVRAEGETSRPAHRPNHPCQYAN